MLSNIDFGSYFHTKKYEKGLSTGGDKIADWGGSKGGWGGHVPPSLYVKRGPETQRLAAEYLRSCRCNCRAKLKACMQNILQFGAAIAETNSKLACRISNNLALQLQ